MVLNRPQKAMGSEYVLIDMKEPNYSRILNMPESAEIMPKCKQICITISNVVNMAEFESGI